MLDHCFLMAGAANPIPLFFLQKRMVGIVRVVTLTAPALLEWFMQKRFFREYRFKSLVANHAYLTAGLSELGSISRAMRLVAYVAESRAQGTVRILL